MHSEIYSRKTNKERTSYQYRDAPFFRQKLHGICPEDDTQLTMAGRHTMGRLSGKTEARNYFIRPRPCEQLLYPEIDKRRAKHQNAEFGALFAVHTPVDCGDHRDDESFGGEQRDYLHRNIQSAAQKSLELLDILQLHRMDGFDSRHIQYYTQHFPKMKETMWINIGRYP